MKACFIAVTLSIALVCAQSPAQVLWQETQAKDPVTSLRVLPQHADAAHTLAFIAGFASGRIACLKRESAQSAAVAWEGSSCGGILAIDVVKRADGRLGVAASTERGCVSMFDEEGKELWRRECTFNLSSLAVVPDLDGDTCEDIVFGGADHRVTCLSGREGALLWSRLLPSAMEPAFVDRIVLAGDVDRDRVPDLLVRSFDGTCRTVSGRNGRDLLPVHQGDPYVSTLLICPDLTGDNLPEFLESGNDGVIRLVDGANAQEVWRSASSRAVRASIFAARNNDKRFFAGTADGVVSCYRLTPGAAVSASMLWRGNSGELCRALALVGDIDGDAIDDAAAGDEGGMLRVYSGAAGHVLWQWQADDVIRSIEAIGDWNNDGITELAVSTLDGTLSILSGHAQEPSFGALSHESRTGSTPGTSAPPVLQKMDAQAAAAQAIPILLYHDIPPGSVEGGAKSPLEHFRDQMEYLEREGFTPVSLDHVAEWCEQKRELPAGSVCITFDGQYASHLTHVAPILRAHRLFAASYITTDWIGTPNHLDWHQLRELEASGVMAIENHSANHPYFTRIAPDSIRAQLVISNESIRKHLGGKRSRHHAYPHGPNSSEARQIASELGFRTATAVWPQPAMKGGDCYRLPRFAIPETMDLSQFQAIMDRYKPVKLQ